jgi:hypothetical protein
LEAAEMFQNACHPLNSVQHRQRTNQLQISEHEVAHSVQNGRIKLLNDGHQSSALEIMGTNVITMTSAEVPSNVLPAPIT